VSNVRDEPKRDLFLEVLRSFGQARLMVTVTSMLPAVWPGDILTVHRQDMEDILPGEIVLCARDGSFSAHRVVRMIQNLDCALVITRGDRLLRTDPPVSAGELLGQVTAIERGNRSIVPRMTFWGQIASWILCRSELCTRVLLRLRAFRRNSPKREALWAS